MKDHVPLGDNASDRTEEEQIFIAIVPDDALEKAAGAAQPAHPGTGVATICVREPFSF